MDFELTDDQVSLQEAIRAFCDGRFPPDVVRNIEHAGARLDRDLWHELGDTGVFSLRVPEDNGGLGLGVSEAVLVFEELGRALVPGPLVATELAAEISTEAAAGHVVVGLVERDDGVIVLEHPADLDALLVLDADGIHLVDPDVIDGVDAERPLDALTPIRHVTGGLPDGELVGGPEEAAQLRREGLVLTSGLQLGIATRTVELATEYAKEREQFGRPIGSFQAVKHIVADMLVRSEVAVARCTPPCARSTAGATTTPRALPRSPRSWPVTPRSPTPRRASRCTVASGTRGSSTCSATGSERRCSTRTSATASGGRKPSPPPSSRPIARSNRHDRGAG